VFTDDRKEEIDTIIWATGYKAKLPFLDQSLIRLAHGVPARTAGMTLPLGAPRLYFIGLTSPLGAQFPVYAAQVELILHLMAADDRSQGSMPTRFAEWESRQRASTPAGPTGSSERPKPTVGLPSSLYLLGSPSATSSTAQNLATDENG
jgi:hypothetical protein